MATLERLLNEKLSDALHEVYDARIEPMLRMWKERPKRKGVPTPRQVSDSDSEFKTLSMDYNIAASNRYYFKPIFQTMVMDNLDRPHPITLDDLCLGFSGHFREKTSNVSETFDVFRTAMLALLIWRRSEPVMTATGQFAPILTPMVLFHSSACRILLVGGLPVGGIEEIETISPGEDDEVHENCLYAVIEGPFTAAALDHECQQASSVLRALFRAFHESDEKVNQLVFDKTGTQLGGWYGLIPDCLDAYYADPPKNNKDSMDRRIRNAVYLLIEADRQEHDAVGLALWMSVVEALIGKKGDGGITDMIANGAATILEPELALRGAAVAKIKQLYNARSMILHGSSVEGEARARWEAQLLASGLLIAMLERRKFLAAAGYDDPETPDKLQLEVQKLKFKPGQLTGVSDLYVRALWRAEADAS